MGWEVSVVQNVKEQALEYNNDNPIGLWDMGVKEFNDWEHQGTGVGGPQISRRFEKGKQHNLTIIGILIPTELH